MAVRGLLFVVLLLYGVTGMGTPVRDSCGELGGQVVHNLICPKSQKHRTGTFCVVESQPLVFFNGCTGGFGKYGDIFFSACAKHDFCYHHEPSSRGLNRKACDLLFYRDMLEICDARSGGQIRCRAVAGVYYNTVRVLGGKSWKCSDSPFSADEDIMDSLFSL